VVDVDVDVDVDAAGVLVSMVVSVFVDGCVFVVEDDVSAGMCSCCAGVDAVIVVAT
jgi:hypothetical protein